MDGRLKLLINSVWRPFWAIYGKKKNLHLCNIFIGEAKVESMERELCDKEEAIRKLQNQLLKAQGLIMKYANWRSFQCFEEGN